MTRPFAFNVELSVFGKLSKLVNSKFYRTIFICSCIKTANYIVLFISVLFTSVAVLKQLRTVYICSCIKTADFIVLFISVAVFNKTADFI